MTPRGIATAAANGLLAGTALAALAVAGMTHDAPLGGWAGDPQIAEHTAASKPVNAPEWRPAYADRFPGCARSLPEGVIPSTVVAVTLMGDVKRMTFDDAWDRTHNSNQADDVWIVGSCR